MTEVMETLAVLSMLVFVIGSMMSLGLSLKMRQIIEPLRNARLVILALVANFILVPIIAYVITLVFPLLAAIGGGVALLPERPATPPRGPGGVINTVKEFLSALDSGDSKMLAALLDVQSRARNGIVVVPDKAASPKTWPQCQASPTRVCSSQPPDQKPTTWRSCSPPRIAARTRSSRCATAITGGRTQRRQSRRRVRGRWPQCQV